MAMNVGPVDGDGEEEVVSAINTTPLVDVMLVLLIIFLITVPVIVKVVPVALPTVTNQAMQTKPQDIVIAVDKNGGIYWNNGKVADTNTLFQKLAGVATRTPQPQVHIRGDKDVPYEYIGRVFANCQRAGILKIAFITEPASPGGG